MHSSLLITSILALASGIIASPVSRATHLGDFRLYGATNCHDENQGVWTVIGDDIKPGQCNGFNGINVQSVTLTDINEGWHLYVYSEPNCTGEKHGVEKGGACAYSASGWNAWTFEQQ